jgi:dienelactone hydrolase
MILTRIKLWLAAAGAFLVALGAAYWRGKSAGADAAERERLDDYVETRRRMDEVGRMSDADAAREWLRERGQR